ncbi:MAG: radical SAM protein [Gammaproteobacteria bacterium]
MKIIAQTAKNNIATVYLAESHGDLIEFVESVQPPLPRSSKWVLIVSSMVGCPVKCKMCDAGSTYKRILTKHEILNQIEYMISKEFADQNIQVAKLKIQFARVGEPTLNPAVLDVLDALPNLYNIPGLMPTISTVAPNCSKTKYFLERLIAIKNSLYNNGRFQLQFSIHSTDVIVRNSIIPIKKWDFAKIASYGEKFYSSGDRKITLNFALANSSPLEVDILKKYFDPSKFLIKITPINPTLAATKNHLASYINNGSIAGIQELVLTIKQAGYEVILSVGELEENKIGSNCGQYIKTFLHNNINLVDSYKYELEYL